MREIKFRAWDNEGRKVLMILSDWGFGYWAQTDVGEFVNGKRKSPIHQYTGLKDRRGVEIYEGDIVKAPLINAQFRPADYVNLTVEFDSGSFILTSIADRGEFWADAGDFDDTLEVIGNIYENPELLEKP